MMVDIYAHPQHMETVKYLSYVLQGFKNHSEWDTASLQPLNNGFDCNQQWPTLPELSTEDFLDQGSNVQW
jgi:hypothetical protein